MIISNKVSIHRVLTSTWRQFLAVILTCAAAWATVAYFDIDTEIPGLLPSVLGTALAFFIGFNNNQAYDRWWEARKIWGAIVNDSRTWARQIVQYPDRTANPENVHLLIKTAVYRHLAFLYALKQNLRGTSTNDYRRFLSETDTTYLETQSNKANAILNLQSKALHEMYCDDIIEGFRFAELNKMLINFTDETGKSERIANTVFPTTYNYYTRIFIWTFIVFFTLVTAQSIGAWSVLAGALTGYVFLTTQKIGQSLLNPFDDIHTGIALNQITRTIEINMLETLGETDIPAPVTSVNGEYIM